jgi:hypothetical protein
MAVLGDGARLAAAAEIAAIPAGKASGIAHHLKRIEVLSSEDPAAGAAGRSPAAEGLTVGRVT